MKIKKSFLIFVLFLLPALFFGEGSSSREIQGTWFLYSSLKSGFVKFENGGVYREDTEGTVYRVGMYRIFIHESADILKFWIGEDYYTCEIFAGRKFTGEGRVKNYHTVVMQTENGNVVWDIRIEEIPVIFSIERIENYNPWK